MGKDIQTSEFFSIQLQCFSRKSPNVLGGEFNESHYMGNFGGNAVEELLKIQDSTQIKLVEWK